MAKSLVSIVNWNSTEALNKCLAGIAELPKDEQPDVAVVDNHSTRDEFKIDPDVRKSLRSLVVIKNDKNLGFAGGHNINVRKAKAGGYDYIFLLNPDTEIIDPEVFRKLAEALDSNLKALGANPTILRSIDPNIIWYGGGRMSLKTSAVSHLHVGETENSAGGTRPVNFLTGCCLAIALQRADLEDLLLADDYFVYWEDTDWSARAAKGGFELLYVPGARLLHHVSDTLGVRSPVYIYYNIRNHWLFVRRNIRMVYWLACWLRIAYITLKYKYNILFRYRSGRIKALKALWWGWVDGIGDYRGQLRRKL